MSLGVILPLPWSFPPQDERGWKEEARAGGQEGRPGNRGSHYSYSFLFDINLRPQSILSMEGLVLFQTGEPNFMEKSKSCNSIIFYCQQHKRNSILNLRSKKKVEPIYNKARGERGGCCHQIPIFHAVLFL